MGAVGGTYDGELATNVTIGDGEAIAGVNNSTCGAHLGFPSHLGLSLLGHQSGIGCSTFFLSFFCSGH